MKKPSKHPSYIPSGWPAVTPRLFTYGAKQLVSFLKKVFGASGRYQSERPSEMRIGDSVVMVNEAGVRPPMGAVLYVYVPNVDTTYKRALRAGARSTEAPADLPYGDRRCTVEDDWGNTWQIATRLGQDTQRKRARPRRASVRSRRG